MTPSYLPLPRAELERLWTEDCRKIVPDFVLFDEDLMLDELDRIREDLGETSRTMSDLKVIITVLRNKEEEFVNVPTPWLWIYAALIILPDMEDNPWFQTLWWVYEEVRGKREITTLWGSASASKSSFFAAMVITSLVVWHGCSHAYISCPYKNSAEDKIFKEITKRTKVWRDVPPAWATRLGMTISSVNNVATFTDSEGATSSCVLVSLETTAQVQGFKVSRIPGPHKFDPRIGAMIFVGDELIINPSACEEYWNGAGNLVANNNFMGWVGMNPLPHQVKHPNAIMLSAPSKIDVNKLKEHEDFTWRTARGRLIRLCMANSPNRHQQAPVYHYIINHDQARIATEGGDHVRQAQVAAWGWSGGVGNGGVLTLDAVTSPAVQSEPVWADDRRSRWIMFDLAFGGRDPAGYCAMQSGTALINGQPVQVACVIEQALVHVEKRWKPTAAEIEEFTRLAEARGGKAPMMEVGREMEAAPLMVLQMLRVSDRLGIPKGRVSFDSSMRPDVTVMARDALGHVPWYYDGTRALRDDENAWPLFPPVMKADGTTPKKWSDNHSRVISAAWRFAEHVIAGGHLHNLQSAPKGCQELLNRPWVQTGEKVDVLGKKELQTSPIYGETLCLALVFGYRFAGAIPQLASTKPLVVGGRPQDSELEKSVFKLRPFKVSSRLWK